LIDQFGKSAVVLLGLAVVAVGFRSLFPPRHHVGGTSDARPLVVWTFDRGSAESFPDRSDGRVVDVRPVPVRLLDVRLMAQALSRSGSSSPVDVVETEIGSTGKYLTSAGHRAFLPLDELLESAPWFRAIPESRRAVWRDPTGRQLLVPRDLHPVLLAYRADLFAEVGLDPAQAQTWDELIELCRQYESARLDRGQAGFRSIELPPAGAGVLLLILQQRQIALISPSGRPDLSDPRLLQTLLDYASWVSLAGTPPARTIELTAADLTAGRVAMLPVADWRIGQLKRFAPDLAGKLRLRPLPSYLRTESNAPTASWGGTGIGIPAMAPDPSASWRLIDSLFRDTEAAVTRYERTQILPVSPQHWTDPRITAADPYFGGQAAGRLLAAVAAELPPQRLSPLYPAVQMELNALTASVVRAYRTSGRAEAEAVATRGLAAAGERLTRRYESTAETGVPASPGRLP
jgi:arabinosaccharide transport system substrate-binding protein